MKHPSNLNSQGLDLCPDAGFSAGGASLPRAQDRNRAIDAGVRPTRPGRIISGEAAEPINLALREHQAQTTAWEHQAAAAALHRWALRMTIEFKLDIPLPCLMIDRLRGCSGRFRRGRNGFGLDDEIGIDEFHVKQGAPADVLETLLHELLHCWQRHHGRPGARNYHNREFRDKALSVGLVIDGRGCGNYESGDSPFASLLRRHGVEVPVPAVTPQRPPARVGSKLKLYVCGCGVRVRVGRSLFNAQCLDCGRRFEPAPKAVVPVQETRWSSLRREPNKAIEAIS